MLQFHNSTENMEIFLSFFAAISSRLLSAFSHPILDSQIIFQNHSGLR